MLPRSMGVASCSGPATAGRTGEHKGSAGSEDQCGLCTSCRGGLRTVARALKAWSPISCSLCCCRDRFLWQRRTPVPPRILQRCATAGGAGHPVRGLPPIRVCNLPCVAVSDCACAMFLWFDLSASTRFSVFGTCYMSVSGDSWPTVLLGAF